MDEGDYAQQWQDKERAISLGAVVGRHKPEPLIVNGRRLCMDCHTELPQARIEIQPDAVRCIPCQTVWEGA